MNATAKEQGRVTLFQPYVPSPNCSSHRNRGEYREGARAGAGAGDGACVGGGKEKNNSFEIFQFQPF